MDQSYALEFRKQLQSRSIHSKVFRLVKHPHPHTSFLPPLLHVTRFEVITLRTFLLPNLKLFLSFLNSYDLVTQLESHTYSNLRLNKTQILRENFWFKAYHSGLYHLKFTWKAQRNRNQYQIFQLRFSQLG
jgi:hypothetical protein